MIKILILLLVLFSTMQVNAQTITYRVLLVSCYDGDTCTVNITGIGKEWGFNRKVRLLDIDTPELRGAACNKEKELAIIARTTLLQLLSNKKLTITLDKNKPRDNFGRLLVQLHADNVNINKELLKLRVAKQYKPNINWCTL